MSAVLSDFDHYIGADLTTTTNGNVATVTDTMRGQQRVLRRLLTNPGDYIWHPEYGAGLPQWIGKNADLEKLRALIIGQMALEPSVASTPTPTVTLAEIANSNGGGFAVGISYTDATTGEPVTLSFNVTA